MWEKGMGSPAGRSSPWQLADGVTYGCVTGSNEG